MRTMLNRFNRVAFSVATGLNGNTNTQQQRFNPAILMFALFALVVCNSALASGGSGDDLDLGDLLDWLVGLLQGVLGKILAISAFLAGIIGGILKGSFIAFGTGMGFAIVLYYGPNIILNVFGASFPF